MAPLLQVDSLHKAYRDGWSLRDVAFSVDRTEIVAVLGPSGSGKTTLLRLIAGLERPDSGRVLLDGVDVTDEPPHTRGFGLMFQEYALFPHRDVRGNVAFGLQMQGADRESVRKRVTEVLDLVGLAGLERRDVNQLSGGERQRVALARSLAPGPSLLMLDEPLGALDRSLRERLLDELPHVLRNAGVAAIVVTHDQEEAFSVADRVVLMRDGRVVQIGAPQEVYRRPADSWAARFLGLQNLLAGSVLGPGQVVTELGELDVDASGAELVGPGTSVLLLVRPEAARIDGQGRNRVTGTVVARTFRGTTHRLVVGFPNGAEMTFSVMSLGPRPQAGDTVTLSLNPQAMVILPAE